MSLLPFIFYDIHRKCKYCGYKDTVKESEKKEN